VPTDVKKKKPKPMGGQKKNLCVDETHTKSTEKTARTESRSAGNGAVSITGQFRVWGSVLHLGAENFAQAPGSDPEKET